MRQEFNGSRTVLLGAFALALAATLGAQSTSSTTAPADSSPTAQPAPGTAPVAGDADSATALATADKKDQASESKARRVKTKTRARIKDKDPGQNRTWNDSCSGDSNPKVDPEKVVAVGGDLRKVKPGSVEDVSAVGNRDIGGRGLGNWYSTDTEIKMGKSYADEIEKSSRFITDSDHYGIRQSCRPEHGQEL